MIYPNGGFDLWVIYGSFVVILGSVMVIYGDLWVMYGHVWRFKIETIMENQRSQWRMLMDFQAMFAYQRAIV